MTGKKTRANILISINAKSHLISTVAQAHSSWHLAAQIPHVQTGDIMSTLLIMPSAMDAGTPTNTVSRVAQSSVCPNCWWSSLAILLDRLGKITVPIATPISPSGNSLIRSAVYSQETDHRPWLKPVPCWPAYWFGWPIPQTAQEAWVLKSVARQDDES